MARKAGYLGKWVAASAVLCLLLLTPFLSIALEAISALFTDFQQISEVSSHFADNLLWDYTVDTFSLLSLTALFSLLMGLPTAYILAARSFKGSRALYWLNILPLTIPTYIASYGWAELFSYPGIPYDIVYSISGSGSIFSILPLSLIFAYVLYPYVFLQAFQSFRGGVLAYQRVSESLGKGIWLFFRRSGGRILLYPIAYGLMLVCLETLNDYGAVKLYGVNTFTSGIFKAWYGMGDLGSALLFSLTLLTSVLLLRTLVSGLKLGIQGTDQAFPPREEKRFGKTGFYWLMGGAVPALAFIFPFFYMLFKLAESSLRAFDLEIYYSSLLNTAGFSFLGAVAIVASSILLSYAAYHSKNKWLPALSSAAVSGYAVPGAVTALGVVFAFAWLGNVQVYFLFPLLLAYMARYSMIAHAPISTAMDAQLGNYSRLSMSLGKGMGVSLFRSVLPAGSALILSAILMVGVEIMKDLPLTLILRDYGTETLATSAYRYANDEQLVRSFPYGLSLIGLGLLAIILIEKSGRQKH